MGIAKNTPSFPALISLLILWRNGGIIKQMNTKLLVSREKFEERTRNNYSPMIETYNTEVEFECGCGSNHIIDENDTFVVKQTDVCEFVVQCPNNFKTLVENDMVGYGHYSIMSIEVSQL
tara:strand:+ start:461 stop:820 length:360 start_codon:yes stop_codon:yes gene_type:complete